MHKGAARSWPWLGVLARLLVGGVWLLAGALKLADPAVSVRAVRAYQLLPESIVPATGRGLPVLEICVGLLLVVGLATRVAAALSALLLVDGADPSLSGQLFWSWWRPSLASRSRCSRAVRPAAASPRRARQATSGSCAGKPMLL